MIPNPDLQLTAYLAVWYLGNIYYNIYNKKACIALGKNAAGASNAHWALSAVQVSPLGDHATQHSMPSMTTVHFILGGL